MKVIGIPRKRKLGVVVGLVVAAAVALIATGQGHAQAATPAPVFTAVQISDGLLFGKGPAGPYLAGLERPPTTGNATTQKVREAINAAIQSDPRWGASFAGRMQSGDPRKVDAALADFATLSRTAAHKVLGKDPVDQAIACRCSTDILAEVWFYQWAVVYEVFFWVVYVPLALDADPAAQLQHELMVRTVATNLSTAG